MATTLTTYHPFDAGAGSSITESQWRDMARQWLATGVIDGEDNEFAVSERGAGANMSVDVATGKCWIRGHYGAQTSLVNLPISTADPTNPRIDRAVLRADFTNNRIELDILTGTPAGSPSAPALTQSSSVWEISLAQMSVPASDTTISNAQITDERTMVGTATYLSQTSAAATYLSRPVLPASAMGAIGGSPTLSSVGTGRHAAWLLDAASTESIAIGQVIPAGWATVHVDMYWTNAGAGSGDVRVIATLFGVADAAALTSAGTASATSTITAPAQNVLKVSRVLTSGAVTASQFTTLRFDRVGADGADTLANDMGVLAFLITKAS